MADNIKTIRSSVVDGIAVTPRYRERQLASLHQALTSQRAELVNSIIESSSATTAAATAQYLLTLKAVKDFHSTVNPKALLDEEYRVAQGKDHATRRSPYGCAYIIASQCDTLYSMVVPVAAAIAAGNCVVLALGQTLSNAKTRQLLLDTLSVETFCVVDTSADKSFTEKYCVVLDGREAADAVSTTKHIRTPATRVAALVDRSGDIKVAAQECVKARFGLGAKSAYAPDVVLVNEFVVKQFCTAVTECALQYFSATTNTNGTSDGMDARLRRQGGVDAGLKKRLEASSADVVVSGDKGTVAILRDRESDLLSGKLNSPLLLLVPISSMDDAINIFSDENTDGPLRANYLFCAPPAAKYLGQFIPSALSCINHIPTDLLVGPAAPVGHATLVQPRYTAEMFSLASPEIIEVSSLSSTVSIVASGDVDSKKRRLAEESLDTKLEQVKEAFGPPVGFFEQGFLFGLSCVLVSAVGLGTLSVKYGYPALISRLRTQ